jgi:hypothetical protein
MGRTERGNVRAQTCNIGGLARVSLADERIVDLRHRRELALLQQRARDLQAAAAHPSGA